MAFSSDCITNPVRIKSTISLLSTYICATPNMIKFLILWKIFQIMQCLLSCYVFINWQDRFRGIKNYTWQCSNNKDSLTALWNPKISCVVKMVRDFISKRREVFQYLI